MRKTGWHLAERIENFSEGFALSDVTKLLTRIKAGDGKAVEELLPAVYDELRRLAAQRLAREAPGNTFQATELVHEAYLRWWVWTRNGRTIPIFLPLRPRRCGGFW